MTSILEETLIDMLGDIKDNQLRLSRLERREFRQRHLNAGKIRDLTIATGAITIRNTDSFIRLDTESAGATDELDTINGGFEGLILILSSKSGTRVPTIQDFTDNILLSGNFALDNVQDSLMLIKSGATNWVELTRSNNA